MSVNQELAAKKNRETLRFFLEDIDLILEAKSNNYESLKFDKEDVYEYGFKDSLK